MNQAFGQFPATVVLPHEMFPASFYGGSGLSIELNSGLTTLLGPNGAGKTKAMMALRDRLRQLYGQDFVRFISAGRMGMLEGYRSNIEGTGRNDAKDTHIGSYPNAKSRKASETVSGDFYALISRSDLRLKVESRLQGLFGRSIKLAWTQNGLKIDFKSLDNGTVYGAGDEASGLMHLVAMLAAIYDDEIKFLIIDEPEVSLHPQLQAFVLSEIQNVLGNPDSAGKKCVIISTHSPAMLHLKKVTDLPSLVFFNSEKNPPCQINPVSSVLLDNSLNGLVIRLSESYKIAMFASSVLLSEGVSDQIVINTLAEIKKANFSSTGVQVVSVEGKGELRAADLLFNAIGKQTCMLADLDILDSDTLCRYLDDEKNVSAAVTGAGFSSLVNQFVDLRTALTTLISSNWSDVSVQAATQSYWKAAGAPLEKERSVLSYIASATPSVISLLPNAASWINLQSKLITLLNIMDSHGLILIRKGSIEDCYTSPSLSGLKKPLAAAAEATFLLSSYPTNADTSYEDILKAISKIKKRPLVDEASLLRAKLGSILGALESLSQDSFTNENITRVINDVDADITSVFQFNIDSSTASPTVEISVVSRLYDLFGHKFKHQLGTPLNLETKLPSSIVS